MNPNDSTSATPTIDPVFVEGVVDRGTQKRVAMSVNINFDLEDGNKRRGHAIPIHHVPLMRRMYPSGVVKVVAYWPRGIPRTRDLTQEELQKELESLTRSYGRKLPGEAASILAEVYGATEAVQFTNIHAKMGEIAMAWMALEQVLFKRLADKYPGQRFSAMELHGVTSTALTADEIDALVAIVEPERKELAEMKLPELPTFDGITGHGLKSNISAAAALGTDEQEQGDKDQDPVDWLVGELMGQLKLDGGDAGRVAAMIIDADGTTAGADADPTLLGTVQALQKADGTLHGTKGDQIKRMAKAYRAKVAAALESAKA